MKIILTFLLILNFTFALQAQEITAINTLINDWHKAAANANAEAYFGAMSDNSIYIGTDATERWTKKEFISFGKPYFDKGSAWDFKPYDRLLHFSEEGNLAWFSELLDTWMGICRGSGVLTKVDGEWKITHYHLSVTVPNEIIEDFIDLVEKRPEQTIDKK